MQCNDRIKGKYQQTNLIEFYRCLPSNEYAQLKSHAYGVISVFSWLYLCEKTFSKTKYVESHFINDVPLQSILMIENNNVEHLAKFKEKILKCDFIY